MAQGRAFQQTNVTFVTPLPANGAGGSPEPRHSMLVSSYLSKDQQIKYLPCTELRANLEPIASLAMWASEGSEYSTTIHVSIAPLFPSARSRGSSRMTWGSSPLAACLSSPGAQAPPLQVESRSLDPPWDAKVVGEHGLPVHKAGSVTRWPRASLSLRFLLLRCWVLVLHGWVLDTVSENYL